MKALGNINLSKVTLLGGGEATESDERVLELFRNRAELKKAYSELQDEIHSLKDRLKQQEGVTAHVQEMLQDLESRLESPATAYPVLVFYSLKRLWSTGNALLVKFATDQQEQFIASESKAYFFEHNRRRFGRRRALEAALQQARDSASTAEKNLAALETERTGLTKPWHYFKRKELEQKIGPAQQALAAAQLELEPARQALLDFEREALQPFPGLSVESRRNVNLATIAYAEELTQRLTRTPIVGLAKAASLKRTCGEDYGNRSECEALIEDVGRASAILEQKAPAAAELRPRMDRIRSIARYAASDDCVPEPDSLNATPPEPELDLDLNPIGKPKPAAKPTQPPPNVLASDSWDILKVLLR